MWNLHQITMRRAVRSMSNLAAKGLVLLAVLGPIGPEASAQRRTTAPPADPVTDDFDVVFFGPQGAVFLRLQIDVGSNSVIAIRRTYAGSLLRSLDADGDGVLSADEAVNIPANGQRSAAAETLAQRWSELDVAPQDGSISQEELFQFVDAQLGPQFRIVAGRPRLQQTVQLSGPLDVDENGLVSFEEIQQGLNVLRSFDFDDDETLSVAELQPFPTAILQAQQQQQANRPAELALNLLQTPEDRERVLGRLMNLYGSAETSVGGGASGVPCDRIGMPPPAVKSADADANELLDETELRGLLAAPTPALELAVLVSRARVVPPQRMRPTPLLALPSREPGSRPPVPGRPQLLLAGMDVEFRANDNKEAGISDLNVTLGFYLQRFLQFDADKNGYLNEIEFNSLQVPDTTFAAVDADRDSMLTRDELRKHVQESAALSQAALVLTVSDEAKTLFEILDKDQDFRLGPREFASASSAIGDYDRDRDGRIATAELRKRFGFEISAARPQFLNDPFTNPNMMQQARQGRVRPATSGPTWFRKMDRNQDGDLTWREFLGQRTDFSRIDANQDGLIDLNEAVAAE